MSIKIKQHDIKDCGAACLASIGAHYKVQLPIAKTSLIFCITVDGKIVRIAFS